MANMLRPTAGSGFAVYRVDAGLEMFPHIPLRWCGQVSIGAATVAEWRRAGHWTPASPTFRNT